MNRKLGPCLGLGIAELAVLLACGGDEGALARVQFGATQAISSGAPASRVVAIRAGRLFDSKSDQLLRDQVVLVRGDRISAVTRFENNVLPSFGLPRSLPNPGQSFRSVSANVRRGARRQP